MENKENIENQAYAKMAQFCSRSEQCTTDIRKKIAAFGLNNESVDDIIKKLTDENFLNDERYVNAYISDKFKINKWGKIKLRYNLKIKGLPEDAIQSGLDNISDEDYKKVVIKTMKDKAKTIKKKNKFDKMGQVIRFTQGRGFEPEIIHRYLKMVIE